MPRLSVVVSTYNRPAALSRLLAALAAQTHPDFEVVVVDNGSAPDTQTVLANAQGLNLRTVRHARTRGPAGGRNSGWRAACGRLIAFTDDDCEPAPDWLQRLSDCAEANPGAVVQGRVIPDPAQSAALGSRLWARVVEVGAADGRFETANILYPRALLRELGGFDEGFGLRPSGEDSDLGWAARGHGAEVVFAGDAVVRHEVVQLGPRGMLGDGMRWAACARLFRKHPAARRELLDHVLFWNVWHYLLWRSLLALAAPPWLRKLLIGRHLRALKQRARALGSGAWAIPYLLLQDAVESATMLRASIRERTPLL